MTNAHLFLSCRNHERRDPCHGQGSQQNTWQDGMARADRWQPIYANGFSMHENARTVGRRHHKYDFKIVRESSYTSHDFLQLLKQLKKGESLYLRWRPSTWSRHQRIVSRVWWLIFSPKTVPNTGQRMFILLKVRSKFQLWMFEIYFVGGF